MIRATVRWSMGLAAASVPILMGAVEAPSRGDGGADPEGMAMDAKVITCALCMYSSVDGHAFPGGGDPSFCETAEEREQNNCRACGGESECHADFRSGSCHVECAPLEIIDRLAQAVSERDAVLVASFLKHSADEVTYNIERGAIQVLGCGQRIVAHWTFPAKALAAIGYTVAVE